MSHEIQMTREIEAEADTPLTELIDAVQRGETIVLTREGRRIARIVPEPAPPPRDEARQREIDEAIADIEALREETGTVTLEELLSWRHEGHKY